MITQHLVEHLGIVRIAIDRVTKERVRDDIGDAKRPEQILAVSEHPLEHVSERGEARTERLNPRRIGVRPLKFVGQLIRWTLPHEVEPFDEHIGLSARRLARGPKRRVRKTVVQPAQDHRRINDDLVVSDEHRDEALATDRDDRRAIVAVSIDPVDLNPLVCRCKRNPLDVGRERTAVDPERSAQASNPSASILSALMRTVMRVSSGLRHG